MHSPNSDDAINMYLINTTTYIIQQSPNGNYRCISHLKFGPPYPNWMFRDHCKCMGTVSNNFALSPRPHTSIAVCSLEGNRVFWTWFSGDSYYPVLFFETLSPPGEGTSLAFAEYHKFYSSNMLIDLQNFEVPEKCMHNWHCSSPSHNILPSRGKKIEWTSAHALNISHVVCSLSCPWKIWSSGFNNEFLEFRGIGGRGDKMGYFWQ